MLIIISVAINFINNVLFYKHIKNIHNTREDLKKKALMFEYKWTRSLSFGNKQYSL